VRTAEPGVRSTRSYSTRGARKRERARARACVWRERGCLCTRVVVSHGPYATVCLPRQLTGVAVLDKSAASHKQQTNNSNHASGRAAVSGGGGNVHAPCPASRLLAGGQRPRSTLPPLRPTQPWPSCSRLRPVPCPPALAVAGAVGACRRAAAASRHLLRRSLWWRVAGGGGGPRASQRRCVYMLHHCS